MEVLMSRPVYKWLVIFDNGETLKCHGETPEHALYEVSYDSQCNIVAIIRVED
jgi:hypothetical protein